MLVRGSRWAIHGWIAGLTIAVVLVPEPAAAEWQIKPFVGFTFGGGTTFVDLDRAVGTVNGAWGITGVWLGEMLGIEGEIGFAPGFFQSGEHDPVRVVRSSVRTATGSLVIAWPRRMSTYTLRPYFVTGMGAIHVSIEDNPLLRAFPITATLTSVDIGGGATGFISETVGVSWDLRHFRGYGGQSKEPGLTVAGADQRLSFWRANMALALKF